MFKRIWKFASCLALAAVLLGGCGPAPIPPAEPTAVAPSPTRVPPTAVPATPTALPQPTQAASPTPAPARAALWTFATQGEVWSSPAVKDGVVYFGSDDHYLYAVDAATRQLKWKFKAGDQVRSRPALADGLVYFTSDDNYLYAVNAGSGRQVWKLDMGRQHVQRKPVPESWDYMQSSPAVAGGLVYAGAASANPNLIAVDARTGKEKWHYQGGYLHVRSSPTVADGVVYFGDWSGYMHALDAETGKPKWSFNTQGPVIPSATIVDGVVYVGSKFPCVFALDAQTGQKKWCYDYGFSWVESTPAVANGVVYVGSSDLQEVNALDAASGKRKWTFHTQGDPWSSPAVADGVVYIGSTIGTLHALDAGTGAELWRVVTGKTLKTKDTRFDGGVVSSPALADGVVYFGALDGKLYAVSTAP